MELNTDIIATSIVASLLAGIGFGLASSIYAILIKPFVEKWLKGVIHRYFRYSKILKTKGLYRN